ncbi:hypothetical protein ACJJTC_006608 [Scirpophaga incertulas]
MCPSVQWSRVSERRPVTLTSGRADNRVSQCTLVRSRVDFCNARNKTLPSPFMTLTWWRAMLGSTCILGWFGERLLLWGLHNRVVFSPNGVHRKSLGHLDDTIPTTLSIHEDGRTASTVQRSVAVRLVLRSDEHFHGTL